MIKRLFFMLAVVSVPVLMMLQVLQGYNYEIALDKLDSLEKQQLDKLEENKRVLAGIAVYDAPERIYSIAVNTLELSPADPEKVVQVNFAGFSSGISANDKGAGQ